MRQTKRYSQVALILVMAIISFACSCPYPLTEERKNELLNESDFVIKGIPLNNVNPSYHHPNPELLGKDIRFKVIQVYKGKPKSDVILIIQNKSSCAEIFSKDKDTLVVFGNEINTFLLSDSIHSEGDHDNPNIFYYKQKEDEFKRLKRLQSRYTTLSISRCTVFEGEFDSEMIRFLNKK